jgi:ribonuclease J
MINSLFEQGADVLYDAIHEVHVSGHASKPELRKMIDIIKPQFFIPIHGEYRHLVHHTELAVEAGIPKDNVLLTTNGDIVSVTQDRIKLLSKLEEKRIFVEGRDGNDDRKQLGEKGVVFSLLVRNSETGKIIAGPEILTKGLLSADTEDWFLEEAKEVVIEVVRQYEDPKTASKQGFDLQETIRIELRRFFQANIGKKPTVMPIVLDL